MEVVLGDVLPTPWTGQGAHFDVDEFLTALEPSGPHSSACRELLLALRHARARVEGSGAPGTGTAATATATSADIARAVLEIAVEWRMPVVERWAVAWLCASGDPFLRLRWSSRSRDGRFRREGRALGSVNVILGTRAAAVLGAKSGTVQQWTPEEGLTTLARLDAGPVRALAVRGDRMFAGGQHSSFTTVGMDHPPPLLERRATITAAAIGPQGWVGCGDELGRVLVYRPGADEWLPLPASASTDGQVMALAFRGDEALRAVWADGTAAEWISGGPGAGTAGAWRTLSPATTWLAAAAWDEDGERLAVATAGGDVRVLGEEKPAWSHLGARSVAWSFDGRLASASRDRVLVGEPGEGEEAFEDRLTGDDMVEHLAFLGSRYLITTRGTEVVQWDLSHAGSELPARGVPVALMGGDVVTAVATAERGRAAAGTALGHLREYDGRGTTTAQAALRPTGSRIYDLVPHGRDWLVASHVGAFLWSPNAAADAVQRLSTALCTAVAACGERRAHAEGSTVVLSCGDTPHVLRLPNTVADICFAADGTIAALDDGGNILVRGPEGGPGFAAPLTAGSRLLGFGATGPLVREPSGAVRELATGRGLQDPDTTLPAGSGPAARYDESRFAVAHPALGVVLHSAGRRPSIAAAGQAERVAAGDRRIVAAADTRVVGYDVLDPAAGHEGVVQLRARATDDGYDLALPSGSHLQLSKSEFGGIDTRVAQSVDSLSRVVFAAGLVGERVWQAGFDLALDAARGPFPDRPVRIELDADSETDNLPWELLHAANAPLGWFNRPPVTIVRTVRPHRSPTNSPVRPRRPRRPTMLVVRGTDHNGPGGSDLLKSVDEAYDLMQRRTRRSNVRLAEPQPVAIEQQEQFESALAHPVDLLQLWAHCDPDQVRFSRRFPGLSTELVAETIAGARPRLVVIVGCRSGALGRLLVELGVPCVVAMRSEVYSHTVQPLVEDFTALTLEGAAVDLAFADALHRYVLTGQPGAAAVPMLYLATDTDPVLFPAPRPAESPS
ncbi:CHAT domain-containing protein [Streptomyces goshikiensis]|uniref:CHAT domain-containing protein n=1 Tax=Streptomyces goshikiensis TaxID=1942 RepID=UPI003688C746